MHASTYADIIDDKIAEWQSSLEKLDRQAANASAETGAKLRARSQQLKAAIATAKVQLHTLDEQETVGNTMETKDKILQIFGAIDKDFTGYEDVTPYML